MLLFIACVSQNLESNKDYHEPKVIEISAGSYKVGPYQIWRSKRIQFRKIELPYSFVIDHTELTKKSYIDIMGTLPVGTCHHNSVAQPLNLYHPVTCLSWCDAVIVANERSKRDKLSPAYELPFGFTDKMHEIECNEQAQFVKLDASKNGWRLPTEAEWDIAAYEQEIEPPPIEELAWFKENSNNTVQIVAKKSPNSKGIYDIKGNVSEWIWEEHGPLVRTNIVASFHKEMHIENHYARLLKGGNFTTSKENLSSTQRPHASSAIRSDKVGIRLVRTISWSNQIK